MEYDSRLLELQRLSEGKPEQQYGDVIIEAEEPDWSAMEKLANQLLSDTKDLSVFCLYTQAITAKYGLEGFKVGCEIIDENLDKYWSEVYPKLVDEDNEFDPYYRINALSLLLSDSGILKQLNNAYLLTNGLSNTAITIRQALNILQDSQSVDYPGGKERLILDIRVSKDANKPELVALQDAYERLNHIEAIYNEQLPNEQTPSFDAIKKPIATILSYVENQPKLETNDNRLTDSSQVATIPVALAVSSTMDSNAWRNTKLSNRKDVELVLEKVCLYFEEFEPSHPAPLFIRRIQRLMNMDFYDIIKDMTPNSLETLDILIGPRDNHDHNEDI
ncbi:type VI secretion system protein TssA [Faucicola atlantae]|uniref:type VI secretion system protein TssA n=1 Tax=Faucicola atlantae TaxID=34059 RepID=UPI0025B09F84|nr:type VI secretion system protein TssA [Moraxella atlantae]